MTMFEEMIIQRIDGHTYDLIVTYIPNSFVGEVRKRVGVYTSKHELWMGIKELLQESEEI